jgi:hypothetical protein
MSNEKLKRGAYRTLANNGLLAKYFAIRLRKTGGAKSLALRQEGSDRHVSGQASHSSDRKSN